MSTVTGTSATGATATTSTQALSGSTDLASEETFLRLLVAQIQNQDPLNPMDSTQFVTQLAQYSSLEQLIGIKKDADTVAGTQSTSSTGATTGATTGTTTGTTTTGTTTTPTTPAPSPKITTQTI